MTARRIIGPSVLAAIALISALSALSFAQQGKDRPVAPPANQPASPVPQAPIQQPQQLSETLAEIEQLRRLMGPVSARLKDLSPGTQEQLDKAFRNKVIELSQPNKTKQPQLPTLQPKPSTPPIVRPISGQVAYPGRPQWVENHQSHQHWDVLRNTARQLENMAADLEEHDLYEQADRLRDQAGDFWRMARAPSPKRAPSPRRR